MLQWWSNDNDDDYHDDCDASDSVVAYLNTPSSLICGLLRNVECIVTSISQPNSIQELYQGSCTRLVSVVVVLSWGFLSTRPFWGILVDYVKLFYDTITLSAEMRGSSWIVQRCAMITSLNWCSGRLIVYVIYLMMVIFTTYQYLCLVIEDWIYIHFIECSYFLVAYASLFWR